ncbi:fimbrial protein [Morganella morganii]|uniref:fimbrial protein n=1 Tax=Morganella morganii TaxID=582 RepID=UPI001164EE6B|nr:fimbrial protein [Morganella morganii]
MKINNLYKVLALTAGLLPGAFQTAEAGSLNQGINFNATFYGGSCEITAPAQLPYNNGNPVPDDTIPGDKRYRQFSITLSGCQGYFMAPKIGITGNIITTSDGVKLFADPSSTTKGYGVRLATEGNARYNANSNAADNGVISTKSWPEGGNSAPLLNGSLEFRGYLSCGACTPGPELQGGELKATVTYTFLYN